MLRGAGIFVLAFVTCGCSLVGRGVDWIYAQSQDGKLPERVVAANGDCAGWLYDLQLSPDEKIVAAGKVLGLEFFDPETLRRIRIANADRFHEMASCSDIDWSPDGKLLACATWNSGNNVVLYSYEEDRIARVFRGHANPCHRVEFSPDGKLVASIPDDRTEVRVWDVNTGELAWEHIYTEESSIGLWAISFSPDGQFLALGFRGGMELRRATDGGLVSRIENPMPPLPEGRTVGPPRTTTQMLFTPDSKRVLQIGDIAGHHWLTVPDLEVLTTISWRECGLRQDYDRLSYLRDRRIFAGGTYVIYLFDFERRQTLARFNTSDEKVHARQLKGIDITKDGRFLYTADGLGLILKWRIDDLLPPEKSDE